jgi:archaellum component FlaG (FlaF/FlaG flagellin family)
LAGENGLIFDAHQLLVVVDGKVKPEYRDDLLRINANGYRMLNDELIPVMDNLRILPE